MTTAPYIGRARAEWRASCQRHQTKTDILSSAEEAHWLAADTLGLHVFITKEQGVSDLRMYVFFDRDGFDNYLSGVYGNVVDEIAKIINTPDVPPEKMIAAISSLIAEDVWVWPPQ